jgi:hypothetical protein
MTRDDDHKSIDLDYYPIRVTNRQEDVRADAMSSAALAVC